MTVVVCAEVMEAHATVCVLIRIARIVLVLTSIVSGMRREGTRSGGGERGGRNRDREKREEVHARIHFGKGEKRWRKARRCSVQYCWHTWHDDTEIFLLLFLGAQTKTSACNVT